MRQFNLAIGLILLLMTGTHSCTSQVDERLEKTRLQLALLVEDATKNDANPRSVHPNGETRWVGNAFDWTEGYLAGCCWYMYQYTYDEVWKESAIYFQSKNEKHTSANIHDVGLVFNVAQGNGYRLTHNEAYKETLIKAGNTLISRFKPSVGIIQSWEVHPRSWQGERGWKCPVIINTLMNLELLFHLTEITGDRRYADVAISHADVTLKNHFREDYSSYHVVDYNTNTGEVLHQHTGQGYSHESAWARGQAWGLYGYTLCYRYTHDPKYLALAENIAHYIMTEPNTPTDKIPYWDYSVTVEETTLRDVSAAAIIASALYELQTYAEAKPYATYADSIMESLQSERYSAAVGENNYFLLKHSVGSLPHNLEVDSPLIYADYYYLEALLRRRELELNHTL